VHQRRRPWNGLPEPGRSRQTGQALVEFALTLPILLLLLAIGGDFGRAYFFDLSLRDGAFAAARYAAMNPNDDPGIRAAAIRAAPEAALTSGMVGITPAATPRGRGTPVQVSITYVFHPLTPILSALIGSTVTLRENQTDIVK
jgi:Flp pilus assembly protein TadG